MQTAAKTIRFLTSSSFDGEPSGLKNGVSRAGSIQTVVITRLAQALNSRQGSNELASYLIRIAEHAYSLRDMNTVHEASQVLMSLPLDVTKQIGLYYLALTLKRAGQIDKAKSLLQIIADNAPIAYRGRATQTLGRIYHEQGQLDEALRFHLEALRIKQKKDDHDPLIMVLAQSEISHVKSDLGDHYSALVILENLSSVIQIVTKQNPFYFYTYYNELAVELAGRGRLDEAESASEIALASPYAHAYPEWSETREEIAAKRRTASPSVICITHALDDDALTQARVRRAFAFIWPVPEKSSIRASTSVVITASIILTFLTWAPVDRLGESIRPRAPPACHGIKQRSSI